MAMKMLVQPMLLQVLYHHQHLMLLVVTSHYPLLILLLAIYIPLHLIQLSLILHHLQGDPTPSPARETFEGDTNLGGDFYVSPTRTNEAPNTTGTPDGGAEDLVTLTSMFTLLHRCMNKVEELDKDLKDTKLTFGTVVLTLINRVKNLEDQIKTKRAKGVVSDSEEDHEHFDMDGLNMLASATLASAHTEPAGFNMDENVQPTTDPD